MLGFSMNDILGVLQKVMNAFKQLMAWLGILVLPEPGEYDDYPEYKTTAPASEDDNP